MKIECLRRNGLTPYRNSFLLRAEFTMVVDPGTDSMIYDYLEQHRDESLADHGVYVIITHNLYEQLEAAQALRKRFGARIYAYGPGPGIDKSLQADQIVTLGRHVLEVLYTPGDSLDAICLYVPEAKALFSGDGGLLRISRSGGAYINAYVDGLFKVASREVQMVYSSFEDPVTTGCGELIVRTLRNVCRSTVVENALAC